MDSPQNNNELKSGKSKFTRKDFRETKVSGNEETMLMNKAHDKLIQARLLSFHGSHVSHVDHIKLEMFICWLAHSDAVGICRKQISNTENYYLQVGADKYTKYQAHKLSLVLKMNIRYSELEGTGLETSHLCHNHECWNPHHLHAETHSENTRRNRCPGWIFNKQTEQLFNFCEHIPCCFHIKVYENLKNLIF